MISTLYSEERSSLHRGRALRDKFRPPRQHVLSMDRAANLAHSRNRSRRYEESANELEVALAAAICIEDDEQRFRFLVDAVSQHVMRRGEAGLFDIAQVIDSPAGREELRSQLLLAVGYCKNFTRYRRFVGWLIGRAIGSASVEIRYAATSLALRARVGLAAVCSAIRVEPVPELRSKMQRVCDKLNAGLHSSH